MASPTRHRTLMLDTIHRRRPRRRQGQEDRPGRCSNAGRSTVTVVDMLLRRRVPFYDGTLVDTIRSHGQSIRCCAWTRPDWPPCLRCMVPVSWAGGLERRIPRVEWNARGWWRPSRATTIATAPRQTVDDALHAAHDRGVPAPAASASPRARRSARRPARSPPAPCIWSARSPIRSTPTKTRSRCTRRPRWVLRLGNRFKKHLRGARRACESSSALSHEPVVRPRRVAGALHPERYLFDAVVCAYTGFRWARRGLDGARQRDGGDPIWARAGATAGLRQRCRPRRRRGRASA